MLGNIYHVEVTHNFESNSRYKTEKYPGWVDHYNATVFFINDNELKMSGFNYNAEFGEYDISHGPAPIGLMKLDDPEAFDYDAFLTFYEKLKNLNTYDYLRLFFDRKATDVNLRLERM
jgi:hypothetical protein